VAQAVADNVLRESPRGLIPKGAAAMAENAGLSETDCECDPPAGHEAMLKIADACRNVAAEALINEVGSEREFCWQQIGDSIPAAGLLSKN